MSLSKHSDKPDGYKSMLARWRSAGREFLTARDLEQVFSLSRKSVWDLPIPFVRVGGNNARRYHVDDVERYLEAQARAAG